MRQIGSGGVKAAEPAGESAPDIAAVPSQIGGILAISETKAPAMVEFSEG
jgi:hypothetical protein